MSKLDETEMRAFHNAKRFDTTRTVRFNKPRVNIPFGSRFNKNLDCSVLGDPTEESAENLKGWIEETYRDLINNIEYLDSYRVKCSD